MLFRIDEHFAAVLLECFFNAVGTRFLFGGELLCERIDRLYAN